MSKSKYQKRKEAGLCTVCGTKKPAKGKFSCESCLNKSRKRNKEYKKRYKEDNVCRNCGKETDKYLCDKCRKAKNKRSSRNRKERIKRGLCSCGRKPNEGYKRCVVCIKGMKQLRIKNRDKVFEAYGGPICNCCGETELLFLTIDHINNDGATHRKELGGRNFGGSRMHKWLIDNDFPPGFQILCANCQLGKHLNGGICPHKS